VKELARLTLRGRRGQVVALAATVLFSAILIGTLGVLLETGVRGTVETGEYAQAPILVGARQSRAVDSDVDMAVPGRALLPGSLVDEVAAALPSSRVVADRVVPATFVGSDGDAIPVESHPWPAFDLGNRELTSGRPPTSPDEVAVPGHLARTNELGLGDRAPIGFGDEAEEYTVVGLTSADDSGVDAPDIFLTDEHVTTRDNTDGRVAAVGVWPAGDDDTDSLDGIAERNGARLWDPGDRGLIEVVRQGEAKSALVSAAGAFGALVFIVAVFTVMALTGLQIRERSRELAMLRVVGATPKQVKHLLRREIRLVALAASVPGAIVGPTLGVFLVGAIRSWGILPRGLEPVVGPLPFVVPVLVGLAAAEIAARVALRRVVRGSPLVHLDGPDESAATSPRAVRRTVVGLTILLVGLAMACAPWYLSGEAATGLPGLSGLVIALSVAPLGPVVVRVAARFVGRHAQLSAPAYLALESVRMRAARVGSALAPIVLGVALSTTQLFSGATIGAVAADQARTGRQVDLVVTSSGTGVGDLTADAVRDVPGVRSADAIVTTRVLARGAGRDSSWQTVSALGTSVDRVERYADLGSHEGAPPRPQVGEVALGVQGADLLGARVDDTIAIVLPDGRSLERQVVSIYERGLGFGEVLLPIADLRGSTGSGLASELAVTVEEGAAPAEVAAGIDELLTTRPGLTVTSAPVVNEPASAPGEAAFQITLLLMLFGYIAIAVVNSLVVATLARRSEFSLLRVVGVSPAQRRQVTRWEAVFLATTATVTGTLATLPGLIGLTYALSNGERLVPAIDPVAYVVVVALTFVLVTVGTALPARMAMRDIDAGR
jgi:putative ABC transport system permease protein